MRRVLRPVRCLALSVATKKPAVHSATAPTDLSSPAAWASEPLRELIASVPDYVLVLDRRLRVLLANRARIVQCEPAWKSWTP